jgi:hypothetical protein
MRTAYPALALVCAVGTEAAPLDITTCGQTVPVAQTGVLQADLDCPTTASAILMENYATLQLNSHTIKGGSFGVSCGPLRCTVIGPGQVLGADAPDQTNIAVKGGKRLTISNVSVSGAAFGVFSPLAGRIEATNVVTTNNQFWGLDGGRVIANDVVANDNGDYGIQAITLKGSNIEASGNGNHGISAGRSVVATNVTANGNAGAGVHAFRQSRITGLTATGNALPGFLGFSGVRLESATLTGNDDDPGGQGFDLATGRRPMLRQTVCGRSSRFDRNVPGAPATPELGFFGTWETCSED